MKKIILNILTIIILPSILQTMDDKEYERNITFIKISKNELVTRKEGIDQINNDYYQNTEDLKARLLAFDAANLLNQNQNNTIKETNQASLQSYLPAFAQVDMNMFDLNSSFYDQAPDICIATIKSHQDMVIQHQHFYSHQREMLTALIQNQDAYAQSLSNRYIYAYNQIFDIKAYDPLLHDSNLLQYIPIDLNKLSYRLLLLSHEYLTSQELTSTRKWNIYKEIKPLLETVQESCYRAHEFQPALCKAPFNPRNLIELSQGLPDIYNNSWNLHKFHVTLHLLSMLNENNSALKQNHDSIEQICTLENLLSNNNTQCHDALLWIDKKIKTKIVYDTIVEQIAHMQLQKTEPVNHNQLSDIKKPEATKAPIIAPKPQLSKKQQATLVAAEKRAEQSRIDKERHRLALEQKNAAEASKKLTPAIPVVTPATKSNSSKSHLKKSTQKTHKKSEQLADEDFNAILQDAIAENQKELDDKKTLNEPDKKVSSLELVNKAITNINEILAEQPNSQCVTALEINDVSSYRIMSKQIQDYEQFRQEKVRNLQKLDADKEIARKENLKKILRAQPHERDALKRKLNNDLTKKFNSMSEEECEILVILQSYSIMLTHKDIQQESFISAYNALHSKQSQLDKKKHLLKWYLASYPEVYNHIKAHVLNLKQILIHETLSKTDLKNASEALLLEDQKNIEMRIDARHEINAAIILDILHILHSNNGILDISNILYQYKTLEEINQLGRLTDHELTNSYNVIKLMYKNHNKLDAFKLNNARNTVQFLFLLAGIAQNHHYIIDDIITMITKIIDANKLEVDKLEVDIDIILYNFSPLIFNNLQCKNEMALEPLTEDQIADITKISNMLYNVFIEITDLQKSHDDSCK